MGLLGERCSSGRLLTAASLACIAVGVHAPMATAKARPLPGVSVSHAPASLTRGHATTLHVRVAANRHRTRHAALVLAISKDRRLDRHDARLATKKLGALAAHRSRSLAVKVKATRRTPLGRRRLLACVAASSKHGPATCASHGVRIRAAGGTAPESQPNVGPTPDPCVAERFSFCDEFNATRVDTTKWTVLNAHSDFSGNETDCYLTRNTTEGGGVLALTARKESVSCPDGTGAVAYTSGALQAKSFAFLYGTVAVRMKVAGGQGGVWPVFWLLGADCQLPVYLIGGEDPPGCNWPQSGSDEVDIAEFKNGSQTRVWENLITEAGTHGCSPIPGPNYAAGYHTFTFTWSPTSMVWGIDGTTRCRVTSGQTRIPSKPMFLIISLQLGGTGGGTITDANLPQSTSVDYVHITS